jgi:hypothetical protein
MCIHFFTAAVSHFHFSMIVPFKTPIARKGEQKWITLEHGTKLKRICKILYEFLIIFDMTERESITGLLLLFLRPL